MHAGEVSVMGVHNWLQSLICIHNTVITCSNFLMSVRIVACSSLYSSREMAPRSIYLCHLSSWSVHSDRMLSLLPGDTTACVAVLSVFFLDLQKMACQEGSHTIHTSSFESCVPMLREYNYLSSCFSFNLSMNISTSVIIVKCKSSFECFDVGGWPLVLGEWDHFFWDEHCFREQFIYNVTSLLPL